MAYNKFVYKGVNPPSPIEEIKSLFEGKDTFHGKEIVNFAVLGVDEGGDRTDLMIVGAMNLKDHSVSIMSIPRDTYTSLPADKRQKLIDEGKFCPKAMKLTEVYHYAGKTEGTTYIIDQLQSVFNVKFDFYAEMNLKGFDEMVDSIGGVKFDVPQRMYYSDPTQNLLIDLKPGMQTLNGKQAEGLIRYRKPDPLHPKSAGYKMGDLDRNKVQHDFIKAMFSQIISKQNKFGGMTAIANTVLKYAKTNINVVDIPKLASFASKVDTNEIISYTMPNTLQTINGIGYVVIDDKKIGNITNNLFYLSSEPISNTVVDSKDKKIQVLNGGNKSGLAANISSILTKNGYTISDVGNFNQEKMEKTRIIVKNEGEGIDLEKYFKNSEIQVNKNQDFDIVIIIGLSEKN